MNQDEFDQLFERLVYEATLIEQKWKKSCCKMKMQIKKEKLIKAVDLVKTENVKCTSKMSSDVNGKKSKKRVHLQESSDQRSLEHLNKKNLKHLSTNRVFISRRIP